MTNSALLSARYATVARASVYAHREQDSEFAKMWDEAVEQALDLLHSRVFQRCIEGDLEPIMYMGVPVGWMRKFSDKLQIEMLRAWNKYQPGDQGRRIRAHGRPAARSDGLLPQLATVTAAVVSRGCRRVKFVLNNANDLRRKCWS